MGGLNAKAMPITPRVPASPAARRFERNCDGRADPERRTHFDAAGTAMVRRSTSCVPKAGVTAVRAVLRLTAFSADNAAPNGPAKRRSAAGAAALYVLCNASLRPAAIRWPGPCITWRDISRARAKQSARTARAPRETQRRASCGLKPWQYSNIGQRRPLVISTSGRRFCLRVGATPGRRRHSE